MMNYLSEHFTLEEMTASETARKMRIDNTPPDSAIKNLKILCTQILEPARQRFGHPLTITSGFRCVKLNRIVGGQPNSYHLKGMAADIRISDFQSAKRLAELLNEQQLCDLVLVECSRAECSRAGGQWLHVQFSRNPRHKINLTYRV